MLLWRATQKLNVEMHDSVAELVRGSCIADGEEFQLQFFPPPRNKTFERTKAISQLKWDGNEKPF